MQIYHNPRCSKSRETLQILKDKKIDHEVVLYLETPPNKNELKALLKMLDITAFQLIRRGEKIYKEEFKGKELSENDWIAAMLKYPKLIERPIVIHKDKAVIGRPPSNVLDLV